MTTHQNGRICKYNLRSKCRRLAVGSKSKIIACSCSLEECPKKSKKANTKTTIHPSTSSTRPIETSDQTCSICYEVVPEKSNKRDRVFGILPNCDHCFCFSCIAAWRRRQPFHLDLARACPMCRVSSDVMYRSKLWISKQEKKAFISSRKRSECEDEDVEILSRSTSISTSTWSSSDRSSSSSSPSAAFYDPELGGDPEEFFDYYQDELNAGDWSPREDVFRFVTNNEVPDFGETGLEGEWPDFY